MVGSGPPPDWLTFGFSHAWGLAMMRGTFQPETLNLASQPARIQTKQVPGFSKDSAFAANRNC